MQEGKEERKERLARLCQCCGLDPALTEYHMCCDTKDLGDYGPGYPIFFSLMKLCFILCGILFLFSIYKLVKNLKGNSCFDPSIGTDFIVSSKLCLRDWLTKHSYANSQFEGNNVTDKVLMLIYFIIFFCGIAIFRAFMSGLSKEVDKFNDLPSDWTVIVNQ